MNVAKDISQYLAETTGKSDIYYSQLPPSEDVPTATAVIEYTHGMDIDYRAPNLIPLAFQVVCRAPVYDDALSAAWDINDILRNVGNEAWGHSGITVNGSKYIRIKPKGTPFPLKEDELNNIYIAQNFYIWVMKG